MLRPARPATVVTAALPCLGLAVMSCLLPLCQPCRDGLAGLLATLPGVEVAGTAGTAEQALAAIRETAPDVVLMDINLPGASGVEATRRAAQIAPATAVLVITVVDDDTVFAALA